MKQNGSWDSKSDPFGDTIIFEAANNNIKILNYPVRYTLENLEYKIYLDGLMD